MLRAHNPGCLSKIRQVYNEKYAYHKNKRSPLIEMQHLMRMMEDYRYAHWTSVEEDTKVVKAIFWSHPISTQLFNLFPTVVLIDSTYKTNRYRILLLEMVGVTSTHMTFTIAFGYMTNETEPEVTWALDKLKALLLQQDDMPYVIDTNKDNSLMNAVQTVFPSSAHLLCQG